MNSSVVNQRTGNSPGVIVFSFSPLTHSFEAAAGLIAPGCGGSYRDSFAPKASTNTNTTSAATRNRRPVARLESTNMGSYVTRTRS